MSPIRILCIKNEKLCLLVSLKSPLHLRHNLAHRRQLKFCWMRPVCYTFNFKRHYCFSKMRKVKLSNAKYHTINVAWTMVKPWDLLHHVTMLYLHWIFSSPVGLIPFLSFCIHCMSVHSPISHTLLLIRYFLVLETSLNSVIPKCCRMKVMLLNEKETEDCSDLRNLRNILSWGLWEKKKKEKEKKTPLEHKPIFLVFFIWLVFQKDDDSQSGLWVSCF